MTKVKMGRRKFGYVRQFLVGALGLFALTTMAQTADAFSLPRPSPAAMVMQRVGLTDITVKYSSPGVKGRQIWGKLVPYNKVWRTGANAATKVTFSQDVEIGGKKIKAGTYSVFTLPTKSSWTFILNTNAKAMGLRGYDKKNNVLELAVTPKPCAHRERLTFLFANTTDAGTQLRLEWEKLCLGVGVKVFTGAQATAGIKRALSRAWRPHYQAGRYYLGQNKLAQAAKHMSKSIAIQSTWWNQWFMAAIHGKKGEKAQAIKCAKQAQELGKNDPIFKNFFAKRASAAIARWSAGKK